MAQQRYYTGNCIEGLGKNHEKTSARIVCVPARIRNGYHLPRKQVYNVTATLVPSVTPDGTRRILTAFTRARATGLHPGLFYSNLRPHTVRKHLSVGLSRRTMSHVSDIHSWN
jgi:hypothetical protein